MRFGVRPVKLLDVAQMALLSFLWGASFILIRIAGQDLSPVWVGIGRLAFGSAFLWLLLRVQRGHTPPAAKLPYVLLVAVFNNAIPFVFFPWGEHTVPSSLASILNAATPIFSAIISFMLADSRLSARATAGVGLGMLGVILAVSGDLRGGWGSPLGVVVIVIAALGYAIATAIAKRHLSGLHPVGLATAQLSWALVMLLPLGLAIGLPTNLQVGPVAAVAGLGVLGSGLAYWLYYSLLSRVSATQTVAVTFIVPIWGQFWGLVAGEPVGWTSVVGIAVVLFGLSLLNGRPVRRVPQAVEATPEPARS
ncbi:MAG TPA: DMT family transporter [Deinococcales bacterium]|nr:DMT family transporter [Deinococcales bacterium]